MVDSKSTASEDSATVTNQGDGKEAVDLVSPQESCPFEVGEKVLALFDQHPYKAKVLEIESGFGKWVYHIHYLGWNKNWDEWVGEERLLKSTEENLQIQQGLKKKKESSNNANARENLQIQQKLEKKKEPSNNANARENLQIQQELKKKKESSNNANALENLQIQQELKRKKESSNNANAQGAVELKPNACIGSRRKKRRIDSAHQVEKGSSLIEKHSNVNIPPILKKLLIEDWESRTRLGKLVKLPRSPTVREIFYNYRDYRLKEGLLSVSVEEIVQGLCRYFDTALHAVLLYKIERQQNKEAIVGDLTPSVVYGAEHLLRLIVKLPEILQRVNIEENMLKELHLTLADFLKFFEKRQTDFYPPACWSGEVHDDISVPEEDK